MPLQTGQWNIISAGFNGILNITGVNFPDRFGGLPDAAGVARTLFNSPLSVVGTLELEQGNVQDITGTWSEFYQHLQFQLSHPPAGEQKTYSGYQFNGGQPMFSGPSHPAAHWHLLAGELVYQVPTVLDPFALKRLIVAGPGVEINPTVTTGWLARIAIS